MLTIKNKHLKLFLGEKIPQKFLDFLTFRQLEL
jgi:hypothetical protein